MKQYIILHHTATNRDNTSIPSILAYHQEKFGFSFYHYIISPSETHITRPDSDLNDRGGAKSLDIALTGNFETECPSAFQLKELCKLVDKYDYEVIHHNEAVGLGLKASKSTCPVIDLKNLIKEKMIFYRDPKFSDVYQLGEDGLYHAIQSEKVFNALYGKWEDIELKLIDIPDEKKGFTIGGLIA